MTRVFHIGIPKSGTTSVQNLLTRDDRVFLSRSKYYSTSNWWTEKEEEIALDKIFVESNETLISSGFKKVKLNEILRRISEQYPDAKIIVTIRQQEDAILSMFKYHIKYNFIGTKSLKNWMYNTDLGMDYLSLCMYGDLAKILLSYFYKENIHFLFYEDLKYNPKSFFNDFYKVLDIPYKEEIKSTPKNVMKFSNNQLYFLSRINHYSFTSTNTGKTIRFKKFRSLENKVKHKIIELIKVKCPSSFFDINSVDGFLKLSEEYRKSNKHLSELGFVSEDKLNHYQYRS